VAQAIPDFPSFVSFYSFSPISISFVLSVMAVFLMGFGFMAHGLAAHGFFTAQGFLPHGFFSAALATPEFPNITNDTTRNTDKIIFFKFLYIISLLFLHFPLGAAAFMNTSAAVYAFKQILQSRRPAR
jgi:hypothetical protein